MGTQVICVPKGLVYQQVCAQIPGKDMAGSLYLAMGLLQEQRLPRTPSFSKQPSETPPLYKAKPDHQAEGAPHQCQGAPATFPAAGPSWTPSLPQRGASRFYLPVPVSRLVCISHECVVNTIVSEPFSRMCHEPRNVLDKIVKLCQHVSTFLKSIVGLSMIKMLKRGPGLK